jgi:hypothetical protein
MDALKTRGSKQMRQFAGRLMMVLMATGCSATLPKSETAKPSVDPSVGTILREYAIQRSLQECKVNETLCQTKRLGKCFGPRCQLALPARYVAFPIAVMPRSFDVDSHTHPRMNTALKTMFALRQTLAGRQNERDAHSRGPTHRASSRAGLPNSAVPRPQIPSCLIWPRITIARRDRPIDS